MEPPPLPALPAHPCLTIESYSPSTCILHLYPHDDHIDQCMLRPEFARGWSDPAARGFMGFWVIQGHASLCTF
jgi:hypothetical protein